MKLKELIRFLDELDKQGTWLIRTRHFLLKFKDEKKVTISRELNRFLKDGIVVHIAKDLYANPRAKSSPEGDHRLIAIAKVLRPYDQFYVSLDRRANELGLITQVPNRITFVTDGLSYTYRTPYGIIEFTHQNIKDLRRELDVEYDEVFGVYAANEKKVVEDTKKHKRYYLLGLMEENAGI